MSRRERVAHAEPKNSARRSSLKNTSCVKFAKHESAALGGGGTAEEGARTTPPGRARPRPAAAAPGLGARRSCCADAWQILAPAARGPALATRQLPLAQPARWRTGGWVEVSADGRRTGRETPAAGRRPQEQKRDDWTAGRTGIMLAARKNGVG